MVMTHISHSMTLSLLSLRRFANVTWLLMTLLWYSPVPTETGLISEKSLEVLTCHFLYWDLVWMSSWILCFFREHTCKLRIIVFRRNRVCLQHMPLLGCTHTGIQHIKRLHSTQSQHIDRVSTVIWILFSISILVISAFDNSLDSYITFQRYAKWPWCAEVQV